MEQLHVRIEGQVQGVGFRYSTFAKARSLGLRGWVRNLPDGRVEAVFVGERMLLEQMLAWCRHGPVGARVREVEAAWSGAQETVEGFEIRH